MTEHLCTTKHRVYKNDSNGQALPIPHPAYSTTRCKVDWAATEAAAQTEESKDIHWRRPIGTSVECGADYRDPSYARNELEKVTCVECMEESIRRLQRVIIDFPQHGTDKTIAQIEKIQRRIATVRRETEQPKATLTRTDSRSNRVESINDLPVGTRIYYTGDVANLPWWGSVVSHGEVGLRIESDDLEHAAHVQHFNIGTLYEGHCNPRFVTEQAYKEWRERKIAAFKRAS